jgi:hypothetical protein
VPIMCHVENCSAWEAIAMAPGKAFITMRFTSYRVVMISNRLQHMKKPAIGGPSH